MIRALFTDDGYGMGPPILFILGIASLPLAYSLWRKP